MATRVILKKGKEDKIKNYYPFIYKDETQGIMGKCGLGDIIDVVDSELNFVGRGYVNKDARIMVRVMTTKDEVIDDNFIVNKIEKAYKKREDLDKETNSKRIFFSEADGISGLIVDQFADYLSVQFRTPGVEQFRDIIIKTFKRLVNPKGIYERSDVESRIKEGDKEKTGVIFGEIPKSIEMNDNDLKYIVDIVEGQKTGFFLDQRDSRKFIRKYLKSGMKFLDVFSSTGGFSMAALKEGCSRVVAIDKSKEALKLAKENYNLNNFKGDFETLEGDAFEILKDIGEKNEKFDVVILDPPSLIKRKEDRRRGKEFFTNLCDDSFKILEEGGILGVCTCAYHISLQDLVEVTRRAASKNNKLIEVLGVNYQPEDHPWMLQMPETLYLKCLWVRVV